MRPPPRLPDAGLSRASLLQEGIRQLWRVNWLE
jgi:hypothetical protein